MTSVTGDGMVEFRFYRPIAWDVKLVGDFTGWGRDPVKMQNEGGGWWSATLPLHAGEYRFRYVADDQWYTDFAAQGAEKTEKGWISILVVPQTKQTMTARLAA